MLVIESSAKADFKMRIFNSDGSEAEMCGNGARCAASYMCQVSSVKCQVKNVKMETMAGIIEARFLLSKSNKGEDFRVIKMKMPEPVDFKLDLPLKVLGRDIKVNFINTGVPHSVIFVENVDEIDVETIGRAVRIHQKFSPAGANVNFAQILGENKIKIRTYERGVEAETLSCGTGMAAAAIISGYKLKPRKLDLSGRDKKIRMNVVCSTGEVSQVYFTIAMGKINDVWLQGRAYCVYKGEITI